MLYKSLILGIVFSIGIFAVKSGAGLSYIMARKDTLWGRVAVLILFAVTYGLVFALVGLALKFIDPLKHFVSIQSFLKSGMTVHMVMAVLMILWGLILIRQHHDAEDGSRGWLLLVLPCPVCATVILFSLAFAVSFFPDHFTAVVGGLYLLFLMMGIGSGFLLMLFQKKTLVSSGLFLGAVMLLMAGYFILSVTVMPQFAELENVYRLARYQGEQTVLDRRAVIITAVFVLVFFTAGYGIQYRKIRRSTC